MAAYDYINQDKSANVRFKKILIIILVLALLAAAAVGVFLTRQQKQKEDTLEAYNLAIEDKDYELAMSLYRSVKERALTNASSTQQSIYQQTLEAIEQDIESRLSDLLDILIAGRDPDKDQLAYAEGMAEIAGVRLINFVRSQCRLFLNGEISSNELIRRIDPLIELENVSPVLSDIPDQIPLMSRAAPYITTAEKLLAAGDWYSAHSDWLQILEKENLGSFTTDYIYERLEYTEKQMYEPLLEEARTTMSGGRYVTAQAQLLALQEVFPQDEIIKKALAECSDYVPENLVKWTEYDQVEIITLRPLIIDAKNAFDGDQYSSATNDAMVTVNEFRAMLDQLYKNNFVLVDAFLLYNEDGSYREFMVPEGKKPLVIVLDSLNYYVTRRESGNAWNLVIDQEGEVSTEYVDQNGNTVIEREAEAVGILDVFVKENPEFSFDGAKGVISLTGYECLFGYVVSRQQADFRNQALQEHGYPVVDWTEDLIEKEREKAAAVAKRLSETGWTFASSTYANINLRDSSFETIKEDTAKWQSEIGSVIGGVDILNYPFGAFLGGSDERLQHLIDNGFRFFAGQGITPYRIFGSGYLYADRLPVNGFTLRQYDQYQLGRLFNATEVYETAVRP